MTTSHNPPSQEDVRARWEQKAHFWDQHMGERGNDWHRELVSPAVEKLLDVQPGERVLDVGCGNGTFPRRLIELGATVTAVDFSSQFIALARQRDYGDQIDYRVVDATDKAALLALGQFEAITCNMALMDMIEIDPLFRAVGQMLTADGRFVFSIPHPCFNNDSVARVAEAVERDDQFETTSAVKISAYLSIPSRIGIGAPGEPVSHYYFHRPLHDLINRAFAAGLVVTGMEEPAFSSDSAARQRPLSWANMPQLPPVMAVRLRPV